METDTSEQDTALFIPKHPWAILTTVRAPRFHDAIISVVPT
jgi:hypothetical protein